jgi:8-oxo-dGTP pyrophosphatase MutT (NUDIX family)
VAQGVEEGVGQEAAPVAHLNDTDAVQAAGGVVWRRQSSGDVEVLLVHRPKYDDWTHPKGKLDAHEGAEEAALREVEEETGFRGRLGPELPSSDYADRYGRPKHVRFWAMEAADGSFHPNKEVDQVRWLPLGEAREALSYQRDREILDAFAARS